MKEIKFGDKFEILSYEVDDTSYMDEDLLCLNILSADELSEGMKERILELHFNESTKEYLCSILYEVPKNMNDDSISTYYTLNETKKDIIRNYISKNNLQFIL